MEVEPAPVEVVLPVELVLLPLRGLVLLLELVLGVSLRTCFVTLSQHFIEPGEAALGEVVVVEVWAPAIPMLPASIAAAIIQFRSRACRILPVADEPRRVLAATFENRRGGAAFLTGRVTKKVRHRQRGAPVRRAVASRGALRWSALLLCG